ncbi:hypothetical protein RBS60_10975 [Sinomonas sp. ASV486]|uniref:hypothetical protein n=1 Tax=Sinomonas sp. ASV486 TaxID=3051170 RepID=UPI0027DE6A79|nr:hypothetical protein [Sinomonas sp. ASV486]MDQ4490720.1 hypothetical protein [Sinomonas sp. ASV486]
MSEEVEKRPPWSRAPFAKGHTKSVQHGARSERMLAPLAAEIEAEARASSDWPAHLDDARYSAEVASWCWSEAVCARLREFLAGSDPLEWLQETQDTDESVQVSEGGSSRRRARTVRQQSALEQLGRWERTAGQRRAALGLTPVSAAKLSRDLMLARKSASGMDMARLIEQAQAEDLGEVESGDAE